ncbi:MAG: DUF5615 family PIN-like protein [Acidobacteria bacterium]|nr:DUF5615 family PIN-like protein [Acidobacteriota bacterium]
MKIIIDECVPHIVKKRLTGREIKTVQEMGWAGVKNGELLKLVEAEFDIFITSDKNLRYQQNLQDRRIAILLLPSNQVPVIENLLPLIDETLSIINPSEFLEINESREKSLRILSKDPSDGADEKDKT